MKVKQIGKKTASSGIGRMSPELKASLNGLSINAALAANLIDDVGTADGRFIVPHADPNVGDWYAIVQNCAVRVSGTLKTLIEDADDKVKDDTFLGNLTFTKGMSREKHPTSNGGEDFIEWFRLGLPMEYNLDLESTDAVSIGAEPVDAKK